MGVLERARKPARFGNERAKSVALTIDRVRLARRTRSTHFVSIKSLDTPRARCVGAREARPLEPVPVGMMAPSTSRRRSIEPVARAERAQTISFALNRSLHRARVAPSRSVDADVCDAPRALRAQNVCAEVVQPDVKISKPVLCGLAYPRCASGGSP